MDLGDCCAFETHFIEHLPGLLSLVNPVLVALGVHRVELGVHVGLSDEHDEVVLGETAAIVLGDVLYGVEVVLADFYVVVFAELEVLLDGETAGVGGVGPLEYLGESCPGNIMRGLRSSSYNLTTIVVPSYLSVSSCP